MAQSAEEAIAAQRDGYRRVSEEAMKLMSDDQLAALAIRLDTLDGGSSVRTAAAQPA